MWIFWALVSAVFAASRRPFEKNIIGKLHHFTYGLVVQVLSLPVLLLATVVSHKLLNPLHLGLRFWIAVAISSVLYYPFNTYLYKLAMKDGELSKVLPLQSLWPVFSLAIAFVTLGEIPTVFAGIGIAATVTGVYALGLKGSRLHHPLQPFREDSASRAMLISTVLVAFIALADKMAIKASNPLFYSLVSTFIAITSLLVMSLVTRQKTVQDIRPYIKQLGLIGTLQGLTYSTYLLAIAAGPIAYVSALRSSNILMGSLLGIVIFNEKLTKPKIVSFALIVIGAVVLAVGS